MFEGEGDDSIFEVVIIFIFCFYRDFVYFDALLLGTQAAPPLPFWGIT